MVSPALRSALAALVLFVVSAAAAPGQTEAPTTGPPTVAPLTRADTGVPATQTLAGGWQFRLDPGNAGIKAGWRSGDWAVAEGWKPVTVPHVFNPTPVDSEFLGTVGWYRMKLQTPATPAGFTWSLRFEAARRNATVWLNGRRLGANTNPYEEFTLAADGMNPAGQENTLVVRVSNKRTASLREGWWNWGGLTRPVSLVPVGEVTWNDLGILSDVKCAKGARTCAPIARTDGIVESHVKRVTSPRLDVKLTSPAGDVSTKTVTVKDLKPFERRRVGFPMDVTGKAQLWSPKTPNLYAAHATVGLGDAVTDVDDRHIGLRYVRVQGGELYLNGHRLQVRGASIQDDLPGRGPALRDQDIETIIGDLKKLGANVTREQYPLSEKMLDRLDEEGILVWSQAPVYHEDEALKTPAGRTSALNRVRHTVLYARNHPSVLTHSVANELSPYADSMPGTRRFLIAAAKLTRSLDDTVPSALDLLSYPNIPRQSSYSGFGLLGINSYYGWYDGKAGRQSTAKLSGLRPFLEAMRRKYPRQAQMITEFGAESTYKGPRSRKETYAFQTNYVDRTLDIVASEPWLAGAIYWTAREFYVKPDWDGGARRRGIKRDALHNKGLIRYDGTPKPAFKAAQRDFLKTPIYFGER